MHATRACLRLNPFTIVRRDVLGFPKMHVFKHVSLRRFTYFDPYLVQLEICKRSYNSQQM
jgi:hypothetical protein